MQYVYVVFAESFDFSYNYSQKQSGERHTFLQLGVHKEIQTFKIEIEHVL